MAAPEIKLAIVWFWVCRLEMVMVLPEKELAMQTLSVEIGTRLALQFEVVVHRLSPAFPFHLFVPPAQVTVFACGKPSNLATKLPTMLLPATVGRPSGN